MRVSIRFHRGGPSHTEGDASSRKFQSAFIAVVRLTQAGSNKPEDNVSIRFHRGGPSHSATVKMAMMEKVSIRFHRGGPSHETNSGS